MMLQVQAVGRMAFFLSMHAVLRCSPYLGACMSRHGWEVCCSAECHHDMQDPHQHAYWQHGPGAFSRGCHIDGTTVPHWWQP